MRRAVRLLDGLNVAILCSDYACGTYGRDKTLQPSVNMRYYCFSILQEEKIFLKAIV